MTVKITRKVLMLFFLTMASVFSFAQEYNFHNNWGKQGLTLTSAKNENVQMVYSVTSFSMDKILVNGDFMDKVMLPESFLPSDEGTPDLPSTGQYIAIPQGSQAILKVVSFRTEHYSNVEVSPAPRIPQVSDDSPLFYEKNAAIYNENAFYPAEPFMLSENMKVRGVDAVVLGICPFQYNPVTKELIVYTDVEMEVAFEGGNGHFGEDRLRSRFWEPIIADMFLNYETLPTVDFFPENAHQTKDTNFEYVIITPDDPQFIFWADSIRKFRNSQGIRTGVFQLQQIGGNNVGAIETFINNAYNSWQIPPAACLLLGDYGNSGDNTITSPLHDNYCVSDNMYADVDDDNLPDVAFARITAQNSDQLETMIGKIISYEIDPPSNPDFYLHPVSAGGWQTERWFILCAEVCQGFWANELGKEPIREYAIYQGTPGSTWSSATNTSTVVSYFGPSGLGYIPADPSGLTDWGGSASRINTDINNGAFMTIHRDHGYEAGWGEPSYTTSNLSGLDNDDLTFVFSLNCLTGKYNMTGTCFAEAFHRLEKGCNGIIAASETSYSFVNDVYAWGMFDNMWGDFDPNYGQDPEASDWVRPCFANASGKYYLAASNWPSNSNNKIVTYHLFHHHGDAFQTVYYEVPQNLTVTHPDEIIPGTITMDVTADLGATICLSSNGTILDVEESTGGITSLNFVEVPIGSMLKLTVTKQNYYRYEVIIPVVGPPAAANVPAPSNNQSKVSVFTGLGWNGSGAEYYEVYMGTDNPPTNILNGLQVTDMLCTLEDVLDFNETYYWQIVSVNNYGTVGSEVWSFTTAGEPDEDFETGDFSLHNWELSGDANWTVVNDDSKHGSYAAQSGAISDNQSSSLVLDIECSGFEKIKFYKKVSSELDSDKLLFLIDGIVKGEWSGDVDWSYEQFTSGPGPHNFEWRYEKDGTGSSGDDRALIDFIYLPPTAALSSNAGTDAEICEGNTFNTNGFASNQSSVEWTTAGDGSFADPSALITLYTPGTNDVATGNVTLTLTAFAGTDEISDEVMVTINPATDVVVGSGVICEQGTHIDWVSAEHYASVLWSTAGDGNFDDVTIVNPVYTPGSQDVANGNADLTVAFEALNGCADVAETFTSNVKTTPAIPPAPNGPETVDVFYTPESDYATSGDADSYEWYLSPIDAGTFSSDENSVVITWSNSFQGVAELKVKGINGCGISEFSEALTITIDNTVGIDNFETSFTVQPNPNNGIFTLTYAPGYKEDVVLTLTTVSGKKVFEKEVSVDMSYSEQFDSTALLKGVYYLTLKSENKILTQKIIIQ